MSRFTGPLTITEVDVDKELWVIRGDFVYEVGALGSGKEIIVPDGFISDGASIPNPFAIVMPRWGRWRRAAVVHDYLCKLLESKTPHPYAKTRKEADLIFKEALGVSNVSFLSKTMLYIGVRIGDKLPFLAAWASRA